MKQKIIISTIIAYIISFMLGPPDLISQFTFGFESAFLCFVLLLILDRRKFVKLSHNSMHTLVCILVCIISILSVHCLPWLGFKKMITDRINWAPDLSSVSSSTSFRVGNMWINHLSNSEGILSKDTEWVICSLDPPKSSSYDGSTKVLTFSDSNSVEIKHKNGETVWVDKQHKVKVLGPVLDKENVPLLYNLRYDKELNISSPDELLEIVNKLKAEDVTSVNQP